jgi:hypothetical protein
MWQKLASTVMLSLFESAFEVKERYLIHRVTVYTPLMGYFPVLH